MAGGRYDYNNRGHRANTLVLHRLAVHRGGRGDRDGRQLSVWVIYACAIRGPYSGKVVAVAYAAGAVTHVLLFMGYGLFKAGMIGNVGLLVYAAVIGFAPIILAALASRFFKPELLWPVSALTVSGQKHAEQGRI